MIIDYEKHLDKKLYKWWQFLSQGNIIIIYKDGTFKKIKSSMKEIVKKWNEFDKDDKVKIIIWSAQSVDIIQSFIKYFIKKTPKNKLNELLKVDNLPLYLLENYKKYFIKYKLYSNKDYTFKL
jgi:hypothetical protein